MTSEPQHVSTFSKVKQFLARAEERHTWEAQNNAPACECHPQGLADAWTEAMRLDAERARAAELQSYAARCAGDPAYVLGRLGVPRKSATALLALKADLPGPRAVRAWFLAPSPGFLVLLGDVGTGKSVAAAYACLQQASLEDPNTRPTGWDRESCVWVASAELAALSSFEAADKAWFQRMQDCALLVLDDLGTEQLHPQAQQRLERLLNARHEHSRRTVITSNATKDVFKTHVGARISDRIRDSGRVVNCGNQSLRGVET